MKRLRWLLILGLSLSCCLAGLARASAEETGRELLGQMAGTLLGGGPPLKTLRQQVAAAASLQGRMAPTSHSVVEIVFPDKLRRVIDDLGVEQAVVINGRRGFMAAGGQKMPLPESRVEEARAQLRRDPFVLASQADDPGLRVRARGTREVGDVTCRVLEVSLGGTESRLCLDDAGRIVELSYTGRHPLDRKTGRVDIRYSDYRDVEGLLFPFRHVVSFEGEELVTVTVDSVEVNPALNESLFEPPGQ